LGVARMPGIEPSAALLRLPTQIAQDIRLKVPTAGRKIFTGRLA